MPATHAFMLLWVEQLMLQCPESAAAPVQATAGAPPLAWAGVVRCFSLCGVHADPSSGESRNVRTCWLALCGILSCCDVAGHSPATAAAGPVPAVRLHAQNCVRALFRQEPFFNQGAMCAESRP